MLFEHDRGKERRLQAVGAPGADDAAEAAERGAAVRFVVVRQGVQIPLNGERRPQPSDEPALGIGETNRIPSLNHRS